MTQPAVATVTAPRGRQPRGDQVVVLRDIPWERYDALCRAREDAAGPRMAFLDGALEIISPARAHEHQKEPPRRPHVRRADAQRGAPRLRP